jgi:uncharacterized integral membrane protein
VPRDTPGIGSADPETSEVAMTENEPTTGQPTTSDTVPTESPRTDVPAVPGTEGRTTGDVTTRPEAERPRTQPEASRRTRIGAAWVAVAVAIIVLVALLIFILQNQQQVTMSYFGATGQFPLGVLVLLAAAGGALLVIVLGFARIIQLRWLARRDRRATQQ